MTSRGTGNVLTRRPRLAGAFFVTSLLLSLDGGLQPQADLDRTRAARAHPRTPSARRRAAAAGQRRGRRCSINCKAPAHRGAAGDSVEGPQVPQSK